MQVMISVDAEENSKEREEGMDAMTAAAGSDGAGGCGVLSDIDESEAAPADEQMVKIWEHWDKNTRLLSEMDCCSPVNMTATAADEEAPHCLACCEYSDSNENCMMGHVGGRVNLTLNTLKLT